MDGDCQWNQNVSVKKDIGLTLANGKFIGDGSGLTDLDRTKLSGVDTDEGDVNTFLNAKGAFSGITDIKSKCGYCC